MLLSVTHSNFCQDPAHPKLFLALCFALFGLQSAVAAPAQPAPDPVELSIWEVPKVKWKLERPNRLVYEAFVQKHPHIKVRQAGGIKMEDSTNPASQSMFLMAMAGNTAPDVVQVNSGSLATYVEEGFLYPLDEFINRPENKEWFDRIFLPQIRAGLTHDGHIYGIPYDYVLSGLYYRRDRFRDAGLDPHRGPHDWDELYTFAQKLTDHDRGLYGYGIMTGPHNTSMYFPSFIYQAGGRLAIPGKECPAGAELVDPIELDNEGQNHLFPDECPTHQVPLADAPVRWQVAFNRDPGVMALNFYKKLRWSRWTRCPEDNEPVDVRGVDYRTGKFVRPEIIKCPNGHVLSQEILDQKKADRKIYTGVVTLSSYYHMNDKLLNGQVAMLINICSEFVIGAQVFQPPNLFGYAPFPEGPDGFAASGFGANCGGINSQVKDPEVREAAWAYIRHIASDQAKRIKVDFHVESGYGELVDPQYLRKFGYDDYLDDAPRQWLSTYETLLQTGRNDPLPTGFKSVLVDIAAPVDALLYAKEDEIESVDARALLNACADRGNKVLLGASDPAEMAHKRKVANYVAIGLVLAVVFALGLWFAAYRRRDNADAVMMPPNPRPRRQFEAWMLMFPALLAIAVWQYYPLIKVAIMAFQDYRVLGDSRFIGMDNFINMLNSDIFWRSILNTLYYVALTLGLGFFAPILLAILLQEVPRGSLFFRVVFYLPAVTSMLVLMFLWKNMYDPSPVGVINSWLLRFGLIESPLGFLQDPDLAMLSVIVAAIWTAAGPGSIIYLAALKTVPDDLYDSADMDGASPVRKVLHVTLPYLTPLILINFVGAFIGAFRATENIFVMTGGGPSYATHVLGLEIYYNAFLYLRFGYASALSWVLASLLIGFAIWQLRILKRVQFTTAK